MDKELADLHTLLIDMVSDLWALNKLALIFEKCLKFLNTFSLCCKNKIVFSFGQTNQINQSVIIFNTIKVMNNPTPGDRVSISSLPNQAMFWNIMISRLIYKNIPIPTLIFTPFPSGMSFAICKPHAPCLFTGTTTATLCNTIRYLLSAINTFILSKTRIYTIGRSFTCHNTIITYSILKTQYINNQ